LLLLNTGALAQEKSYSKYELHSGNDLLTLCQANGTDSKTAALDEGVCNGYIRGTADVLRWGPVHIEQFVICAELRGVTNGQLRDAVVKYLMDNPDAMAVKPSIVTLLAFRHAFPCDSGRKSKLDGAPSPGVSSSTVQTTTAFRGHALGESWQSFIRTEEGLCKMKLNTESCSQAGSGAAGDLLQFDKTDKNGKSSSSVVFHFDHARLEAVVASMIGPTFADLSFLEKTYGPPVSKGTNPEKAFASSTWLFSDGGEVHAEERANNSGGFTINIYVRRTPE
jgi:hypothetical protein